MKLILAILAGLFLGSAAGIGIFYHHEIKNFRAAYWEHPPIVVDCTYGSLDKKRLNSAIDFWREYDHYILYTELNPTEKMCNLDQMHGFIIIKNATLTYNVLGVTSRYTNMKGIINSALIEINIGDANLERLLEHELGHAFGYRHLNIDHHIMHSDYDAAGWEFWDGEE
jgi:hypothetical protein